MEVVLRVSEDGTPKIDRAVASTDRLTAATTRAAAAARKGASSHTAMWSETDRLRDAIDRANRSKAAQAAALGRTTSFFGLYRKGTADAALASIDLGRVLNANASHLLAYGAAIAAVGVATATYLVKRGLEQNAIMQQSRLGMAALVSSLADVTDAQGNVLEGQAKWNASLVISEQLQKRLVKAFAEVVGSYKDGVKLMQMGLGPMIQAGITDPADIVKFVQNVAQVGTTLGVPGERLGQEIKALLKGEKGPDNDVANALLGDISKEKFDQLKEAGQLLALLTERMAAYGTAGQATARTLAGAWSNLNDAVDQALGQATAGTASALAMTLEDLTRQIVTFDEAGNQVFNPEFIEGVTALAEAMKFLAEGAVFGAKEIPGLIQALKDYYAVFEYYNTPGSSSRFRLGPTKAPLTVEDIENERIFKKNHEDQMARLAAIQRGQLFFSNQRDGAFPYFETTRALKNKSPLASLGFGGGYQPIDEDTLAEMGKFAIDHDFAGQGGIGSRRMREILMEYVADGKLTIEEMRNAESRFLIAAGQIKNGPLIKGKKGGPAASDISEARQRSLEKLKDDWARLRDTWEREAAAEGDPLGAILAKIEEDRQQKLDQLKAQQREYGKVLGGAFFKDQQNATNEHYDQAAANASFGYAVSKGRDFSGVGPWSDDHRKAAEIAAGTQRAIEDARMDVIRDAIERQLQEKLAANQREFEADTQGVAATSEVYQAAVAKRMALNALAYQQASQARAADLVGTKEWAAKTAQLLEDQYEKVPELVRRQAIEGRLALTSGLEDFFNDLMAHNADAAKSFEELGQTLGKSWAHNFAVILTNGQSVSGQLKDLWKGLNASGNPMTGSGGGAMLNAGVAGAGLGSFVGGAFGGPNNQAGMGGTIGGALGAVIGSIIPGLGTAWGAVIGSALGTAVGSLIQKGEDSIKVAIVDGVATVTEKGISFETRMDLRTQVNRRVRDEMKSWRAILDLLPQEMKDELAKLPPPSLNLTGGVEDSDIRDESALQSIEHFLGEKMPKAAFAAYRGALEKAFALLGVEGKRIQDYFAYFGTLQGQELHDAVQRFFLAIIEANDWQKKIGASPGDFTKTATDLMDQTPLGKMQDLSGQIGLVVASMSKLTDVDDLVAAQERLNALSGQYYDAALAAEQQRIALQRQLHDENQSLAEQINLAGMGDQEKLDYYYAEMEHLRAEMQDTSDPAEFARLERKLNAYLQAAFGMAPDNEENRKRLLLILGDIDQIRDEQFDKAGTIIADENQKAATMLQDAATALKGAADALNPPAPDPTTPDPDDPTGPAPDAPDPNTPIIIPPPITDDVTAFGAAVRLATAGLRHLADWTTAPDGQPIGVMPVGGNVVQASATSSGGGSSDPYVVDISGAMRIAIDVNADGLVEVAARIAEQRIIARIRRDRDLLSSKVGGK